MPTLTSSPRWKDIFYSPQLWVVVLALFSGLFAYKVISGPLANIDPSLPEPLLLVPILIGVAFVGLRIFGRSLTDPFYPYFMLQFLFFFMLIPKAYPLCFGMGLVAAVWSTIRDFRFLWQFVFFRSTFIFSILNMTYFLCGYGSDFNLSNVTAGYPIDFEQDASAQSFDAKTIVMLAGLSMWVSLTVSLWIFRPVKTIEELQALMFKVLCTMTGVSTVYFVLTIVKSPYPQSGYAASMMCLMLLTTYFWAQIHGQGQRKVFGIPIIKLLWFTLPVNLCATFFAVNKTSLVALGLSIAFFLWGVFTQCYRFNPLSVVADLWQNALKRSMVILSAMTIAVIALALNVVSIIQDKVDYFQKGFSSASTLDVRSGNWHYFFLEWADRLSLHNVLLGFGLGASRPTIFYVSAMRMAGSRTLVQTVHNHYMELFFDYGMVALILYWGSAYVALNNMRLVFFYPARPQLKLMALASLSIMIYVIINGLTDGFRVQTDIIYFSTLGVIEGYIRTYLRLDETALFNENRLVETV